jgi:hypothetical protein
MQLQLMMPSQADKICKQIQQAIGDLEAWPIWNGICWYLRPAYMRLSLDDGARRRADLQADLLS